MLQRVDARRTIVFYAHTIRQNKRNEQRSSRALGFPKRVDALPLRVLDRQPWMNLCERVPISWILTACWVFSGYYLDFARQTPHCSFLAHA